MEQGGAADLAKAEERLQAALRSYKTTLTIQEDIAADRVQAQRETFRELSSFVTSVSVWA